MMQKIEKLLNIEENTPQITYNSALKISEKCFITTTSELCLIPELMLNFIMTVNPNSRELCISENLTLNKKTNISDNPMLDEDKNDGDIIHPMDVFIYLFLKCENSFKHVFVNQVSKCQFSLPLVINNLETKKPMLFAFPYQNMTKTYRNKDGKPVTFHVMDKKLPIISFIRIGSCSRSIKSKLINLIMGFTHDCFFHRESKGSCRERVIYNGTIEMNWYLPKGDANRDLHNEPLLFFNLRGDAFQYEIQLDYIMKISSILFIMITGQEMGESEIQKLEKLTENNGKKICLIFTDWSNIDRTQKNIYVTLNGYVANQETAFLMKDDTTIRQLSEMIQKSIPTHLNKIESVSAINDHNLKFLTEINYIEKIATCQATIDNLRFAVFSHVEENEFGTKYLPLQTIGWKDYCRAKRDIESCYVKLKMKKKLIGKMELSRARELQKEALKQSHKLFKNGHLLLNLEDLEKCSLHWTLLKQDLEKINISLHENKNFSNKCLDIQKIVREYAQYYEVCDENPKSIRKKFKSQLESPELLPKLFAHLLMLGQPLEILDGDANNIALNWVSSVIRELSELISYQKIFVLGVLGIQSSGKSTLLNTLFGLQFPVSMGRCTRGVSMQLIAIDSSLKLSFQYLVILDTEGLRAQEMSEGDRIAHDNELATFVVGLSDLTIVNIMGENPSEWKEIFQIIILALVRLNISERKKPNCIFVHQNIPEIGAKERLAEGYDKFISQLDEVTRNVCEEEKSTQIYTKFNEVIDFEYSTNVKFFPPLYEELPPMSIISSEYSKCARNLKNSILDFSVKASYYYTLDEWANNVEHIWTALLKQNLVFSYKNYKERSCYLKFEKELNQWAQLYVDKLQRFILELKDHIITYKNLTLEEKLSHFEVKIHDACHMMLKQEENQLMKLYFIDHKDSEIFKQWEFQANNHFNNTRSDQEFKLKTTLKSFLLMTESNMPVLDKFNNARALIIERAKKSQFKNIIQNNPNNNNDAIDSEYINKLANTAVATLDEAFEKEWECWSSDIDLIQEDSPPSIDYILYLKKAMKGISVVYNLEQEDWESVLNFLDNLGLKDNIDHYATEVFILGMKHFTLIDLKTNKEVAFTSKFECWIDYLKEKVAQGCAQDCLTIPINSQTMKIHQLVEIISQNCMEYIENVPSESIKNEHCFDRVINIICDSIVDFNEVQSRETNAKIVLNSILIHELILYWCSVAIQSFETKLYDAWESTYKKQQIMTLKSQLKVVFLEICQNDSFSLILISAKTLADILFDKMKNFLKDEMLFAIKSMFDESRYSFPTKSHLHVHVLIELLEKKSFDDYMRYIKCPHDVLKEKITDIFTCFMQMDNTKLKLKKIFEEKISICSKHYNKSLIQALEPTSNESAFKKENIDKTWKQKLHKMLESKYARQFSEKDLDIIFIESRDILDPEEFVKLFKTAFEELCISQDFNHWTEMYRYVKKCCKLIIDNLFICYECCPMCNEPCMSHIKSDHVHFAGIFHRPLAVNGYSYVETGEFIGSDCPNLDNRYKLSFEKEKNMRKHMDGDAYETKMLRKDSQSDDYSSDDSDTEDLHNDNSNADLSEMKKSDEEKDSLFSKKDLNKTGNSSAKYLESNDTLFLKEAYFKKTSCNNTHSSSSTMPPSSTRKISTRTRPSNSNLDAPPQLFQSKFANWDISKAERYVHSEYWEWVLCHFEQDFVEYYKYRSNPKAINAWSDLDESDAAKSIQHHLSNFHNRAPFWRLTKIISHFFSREIY